jgi:mevalonate kinase
MMGRASGKVILLGEHAVVYGIPAIAAGIDRGAWATARAADRATVRVGELSAAAGDGSDLGQALQALLAELGAPPLNLEVTLELPPGCGLGASAAIGVAVARAVLHAAGAHPADGAPSEESMGRVVAAATRWERVFHGNPSGIDTWAAARGGCFSFARGPGATPLRLGAPLELAIGIAGPPASTREVVERVARLRQERPGHVASALDSIASLVRRAETALLTPELSLLGELLDANQDRLRELGVSTPDLDRACRIAREAGALGAKLTGSGGGGAVLALVRSDAAPVLQAWKACGIPGFCAQVHSADPLATGAGNGT